VLSAHGVQGELKCRVVTDFPKRRFKTGARVFLGGQPYTVAGARAQPPNILLRFDELTDRTTAEKLRGLDIEVPRDEAGPPPRGQFYWHQVIGLDVVDTTTGNVLGKVADIIETGANDVYLVHGPRGEILVPAIKSVIKQIDPENGRMLIEPLPGLLP
jgi:16S rRNA processing protein RimM